MRAILCTLSAANAGVCNAEAFFLLPCTAKRKAFPMYRRTSQIKVFHSSFINTKRFQNIPAVTRIYIIHDRVILKNLVNPIFLFFHFYDIPIETNHLVIFCHRTDSYLSVLRQFLIKVFPPSCQEIQFLPFCQHDIYDSHLRMSMSVNRCKANILDFSQYLKTISCIHNLPPSCI